jgi:hypothetical protein
VAGPQVWRAREGGWWGARGYRCLWCGKFAAHGNVLATNKVRERSLKLGAAALDGGVMPALGDLWLSGTPASAARRRPPCGGLGWTCVGQLGDGWTLRISMAT